MPLTQVSEIATFRKDHQGRMIHVNQTYLDLFCKPHGITPDQVINHTSRETFGEEIGGKYEDLDAQTLAAKEIKEFTERRVKKGGGFEEFLVVKFPHRDAKGRWCVAGVIARYETKDAATKKEKKKRKEKAVLRGGAFAAFVKSLVTN